MSGKPIGTESTESTEAISHRDHRDQRCTEWLMTVRRHTGMTMPAGVVASADYGVSVRALVSEQKQEKIDLCPP
jgi:hypothetical protein